MTARPTREAARANPGPQKFGGLTIGAWREHFREKGEDQGGHMTAKDCRDIARMLEVMSAERCSDAMTIVNLQAEASGLAHGEAMLREQLAAALALPPGAQETPTAKDYADEVQELLGEREALVEALRDLEGACTGFADQTCSDQAFSAAIVRARAALAKVPR